MRNAFRLYLRYLGISFRSQMQYRASFVMLSIGQFFITGIDFLAILVLFDRFDHLQGWSLSEVAFFYGLVGISFAIGDAFARGFDSSHLTIKAGEFDRVLLRPRSPVIQIAGQELTLRRIGRFLQSLIVLLWATHSHQVSWSVFKILFLFTTILGGAAFFASLFILQATFAFWTTESLEIMNALTYGGRETASYPLPIYRSWFRKFFTYVVPLACVNYFPALILLERPDPLGSPPILPWIAPWICLLFLLLSLRIWRFGIRHYRSTGS